MFLYFESRHLSHGQKPFPVDPYKAYHLWCLLGVSFRMFPPDVRYHCIFWLLRFFCGSFGSLLWRAKNDTALLFYFSLRRSVTWFKFCLCESHQSDFCQEARSDSTWSVDNGPSWTIYCHGPSWIINKKIQSNSGSIGALGSTRGWHGLDCPSCQLLHSAGAAMAYPAPPLGAFTAPGMGGATFPPATMPGAGGHHWARIAYGMAGGWDSSNRKGKGWRNWILLGWCFYETMAYGFCYIASRSMKINWWQCLLLISKLMSWSNHSI